jgi:hypothetical protein
MYHRCIDVIQANLGINCNRSKDGRGLQHTKNMRMLREIFEEELKAKTYLET